jgi:ankyrin repeat protein
MEVCVNNGLNYGDIDDNGNTILHLWMKRGEKLPFNPPTKVMPFIQLKNKEGKTASDIALEVRRRQAAEAQAQTAVQPK